MKARTLGISVLVLALSAGALAHAFGHEHSGEDTSRSRTSRNGTFKVSYEPSRNPVPKREIHSWTVELRTPEGKPVEGAKLTIGGGMPAHGHGLPTQPYLREALGNGRYVVDGMKFNMGGYWVVDIGINAGQTHDDVRFELNL